MEGLRTICLSLLIVLVAVLRLSAGTEVSKFHPTPQKKVLEKLLTEEYDVSEWPDADDGKATKVYMQMFINSFGSLNAANMDYSVDVFLRQRWHDQRLAYNDTREAITITALEYRNKIWKPDTYFENVKEATLHQVTMPNILMRIDRSGNILYSMRVTVKLGCPLQLANFPFDEQICKTAFASYAYTDDVIKYLWHNDTPIDLPDSLEIAQFDLLDYQTDTFTYEFATGDFSGVNVSLLFVVKTVTMSCRHMFLQS
ncbi:unnamed protein product [Meganyctiphanes norvegica]|uniref:Neurotransmitter-gated ion-channel ligand-binding domain-containing protein n=1 Tax=Meganyctiphanes norvegica TaxID=48144 RepID=A0AAV2QBY9_MEGNR